MADVEHVHEVKETLHGAVLYPGHPPRRSTPEYERTHKLLCIERDTPCFICGVRHSTLGDAAANWRGATFLETHHFWVQDSLADACSWQVIKAVLDDQTDQTPLAVVMRSALAGIDSQEALEAFVDSEHNQLVLCNVCHIGYGGIHNTSWNYFIIQKFLVRGYKLFDDDGKPADLAQYESVDDHLAAAMEATPSDRTP